jgi:hypothetical protein
MRREKQLMLFGQMGEVLRHGLNHMRNNTHVVARKVSQAPQPGSTVAQQLNR